uniref:Uncharacterized protein n=1 Tax=Avena sativa TaxID=4498 RepID=A0ACD5TKZ9_AVESA
MQFLLDASSFSLINVLACSFVKSREFFSNFRYNMGVIPTKKSLVICENLSASAFCRRRLATILVKLKFAEHLKEAVTFIEQGHVRVGPETITDPAFLVTRNMEDFITWVDTSRIKKKVMEYVGALDDYDAMI